MTSDKQCGTCRWALDYGPVWVTCTFPLPSCALEREPMFRTEGTDCPCYQPVQQPQTETN